MIADLQSSVTTSGIFPELYFSLVNLSTSTTGGYRPVSASAPTKLNTLLNNDV